MKNNKKRDILFLCQFFYPEHNSSSTLPFDTAKYLTSQNFKVDALVGYPLEYTSEKHIPKKELVEGINIYRMKYIQLNRKKKIGRLVNYLSFTLSTFFHLFKFKKYKTVIVYSNPPILPIIAVIAKKIFKTKIVFVSYDIYPEIAYQSNSIKVGSLVDKMMKFVNNTLYKNVSMVVALTDEMKNYIIKNRKIDSSKVVTISNWAHEELLASCPKKHVNKTDKFIVSYFGNMGTCQDIDTIIKAANLLKKNKNILFKFVGHGNKKESIQKFIIDNNCTNIVVDDFLINDDFSNSICSSSCCIVSLENGLNGLCAPSKYYTYLFYGVPVISISDRDSYLYDEITNMDIGLSIESGDFLKLADQILYLSENTDKLSSKGNNSLKLYKNNYSYSVAMEKYKNLFKKII